MKKYLPIVSVLCAAALLTGCDKPGEKQDGAAPSTSASAEASASASATPTPKKESKGGKDPINDQMLNGGSIEATGPDDFKYVEEYVARLRDVVPQETRVNADPQGKDKLVTVKIDHTLPQEEIKKTLDLIQPLAVEAKQTHKISTHVGDRVDGVLSTTETVPLNSDLQDLKKEWDTVMGTVPILKGNFEYSRLTWLWLIAADFKEYDTQSCVDQLRYLHAGFEDEKLQIGDRELLMKIEGCGKKFVVIHGDPGQMQDKIENMANLLAVPGLIPDGARLNVDYVADLAVTIKGAPDPALEERINKEWHQGKVQVINI